MTAGDVVKINNGETRWSVIRVLLTRPRHKVVVSVTENMIALGEARMTWRDWWRCLWRTVIYGA